MEYYTINGDLKLKETFPIIQYDNFWDKQCCKVNVYCIDYNYYR